MFKRKQRFYLKLYVHRVEISRPIVKSVIAVSENLGYDEFKPLKPVETSRVGLWAWLKP